MSRRNAARGTNGSNDGPRRSILSSLGGPLWAESAGELLNRDWLEHAIGVQLHCASPERGLEDVVDVLALALFSGLNQQPGPFQWTQNARGERGHFAPSGVVPVMFLAVERREQPSLSGAMVGFDVDHVHPDIPFAERPFFEPGIGRVVDLENEERDQFCKQTCRCPRKFGAAFGQPEFALEVPPQAQRDQKVVQDLERREFVFIDDLAVAEHLLRALSGPIKVLDRPVHEYTLECLCLGQADDSMVLRIAKRQQRRAQERRVRQVGMVIWKGAELDHGAMLPQGISRGQTQKAP